MPWNIKNSIKVRKIKRNSFTGCIFRMSFLDVKNQDEFYKQDDLSLAELDFCPLIEM